LIKLSLPRRTASLIGQDLQGVADHYQDMRDKALALLDDLRMPKLMIESSGPIGSNTNVRQPSSRICRNWRRFAAEGHGTPCGALPRSGTGEELGHFRPDGVFLNGQHPMRLIPKQDRVFCLEATCLRLVSS
jgi:hypothetical protein